MLSYREIAKRTGWSHAQVANIFNLNSRPSVRSLQAIAAVLKIHPHEVLNLIRVLKTSRVEPTRPGISAKVPVGEKAREFLREFLEAA